MTTHSKPLPSSRHIAMKSAILTTSRRGAAAIFLATLGLQGVVAQAAESAPPPAMAPAGQYQIDKSHASVLLRVNHLGFSTYTTRFSRFDAELTFDPSNIPASKVVTTIDASSFEMDAAPQECIGIVKGPQMLDTVKFPQIVFKSQPLSLTATFNGGYPGMANMDPHARVGFSAHGSFKRSDFGIAFGVPAPGTTMGVGDLINFSIEAEFNGPALAGPAAETH